MHQIRQVPAVLAIVCAPLCSIACGPTLSTQVRLDTMRAPDNTGQVSKEGLVVEVPDLKKIPEQFTIQAAACFADGTPMVDSTTKAPDMKDAVGLPIGAELYQLKLSNQTDHVVRLQGAIIRLFDPAENQIEPVSKEDAIAAATRTLSNQGVCNSEAPKIMAALSTVKFIGPNTELLPGTTTTGYLLFFPQRPDLPGVWKLSLYEIPVKVDAAGSTIARTRFDFAYLRKKFEDTYSQEFMGDRKLLNSKEIP